MIQEASTKAALKLGLRHKYLLCADPAAPLVFLVHGRAGTFDVMWTFKRTLPENCNIIAPQAPDPDPLGGYSWWDVHSGARFHESTLKASQTLTSFISSSAAYYQLRPRKQVALGFSQGAGLLSLTIQREPNLLAAVALLAGFVLSDPTPKLDAPLADVLMLSGSNDEVVPIQKARDGSEYLQKAGFNVQLHEDPVGHKVGAAGMRILAGWVQQRCR